MCIAGKSLLRGLLTLGACLLLIAAARTQSPLLVVDDDGGAGVFTSIAGAVDAAPTGAVILVKSGAYGPFEIVARTLVVVAAPGAAVQVHGGKGAQLSAAITVRDLGLDDAVVVEGLVAEGTSGFLSPGSDALRIDGCAGQVWVQDCQLDGGAGLGPPVHALEAVDSGNVIVIGCTLEGHSALKDQAIVIPGAGLYAIGSRVHVWDTQASGGFGAPGAALESGFLYASRCLFQGGVGVGLLIDFICELHVNGGFGLQLGLGLPTAVVFGTQLLGGPAAPLCSGPGLPSYVASGNLQTLPGSAPGFLASSPTLDGDPLTLSFPDATPGDRGVVLLATSLGDVPFLNKFSGALAVGGAWVFIVGQVPPTGTLSLTINPGDALPAGTGATFFAQGAVLKVGGGAVLGPPAALTQFD